MMDRRLGFGDRRLGFGPRFPVWWRAPRPLSVNQISIFLGGLGLALVMLAGGFIALRERTIALREAAQHARSGAFFLADHAARLFEVTDLALRATTSALGDLDWDTVAASNGLWNGMRATDAALPYIDNLWLNDETGRLRLTSFAFPAPSSTAVDRDIFVAVRRSAGELVIGGSIVGKVTHAATFLVGRRLEWSDGSFRGMISATTDIDYFRNYWKRLYLPNEESFALLRADSGRPLVAYPDGQAAAPASAVEAFTAAVASHPQGGRYQPAVGEIGYYQRIGEYPLYMTVVYREGAVTRVWVGWLWRFLPFPVSAVLALFGVMVLGRRQNAREALVGQQIERARVELARANQRLEERVAERTAELRESNEEIQRFAYIVSHDLRAPLVNIMGFTSELHILRQDLFAGLEAPTSASASASASASGSGAAADETPVAVRLEIEATRWRRMRDDFDEAIGFIQSSIDKMDRLIKAILLLSRQGQRPFQFEPIDMTLLMQSIVDGFAHRLSTDGASVTVAPLPDLVGDRIALEQIFANLIDNALKYARPHVPGRITVSARTRTDTIEIAVADNGRGIDPRDRGRVFDLFRRSGVQDRPGEGIGLAHVRSLVRRLGGSITLDSKLGEGSVFTVVLPIDPAVATARSRGDT